MKLCMASGAGRSVALMAALLTGCAGVGGPSLPGSWSADRVETRDGAWAPKPIGFDLYLSAVGAVDASDGCNSCGGEWSFDVGSTTSGKISIRCTKVLCSDRRDASRLLFGACSWQLEGETLTVPSGDYRIVMRRSQPLIGGAPD